MRAADGYQTYILGSAAAYTLAAQSSSGPTTYDGTAWVAEFMDDYLFGPVNALFYATNQTYAETAESYTASDWLTALGKYICRVAFTEKPFVNLVIKNNASTPNSKVDIDCTSIYVGWKKHETVDLTLDITASGALGLDTGTESADAWYYIWLIAKLDGTLSGVLSASATTPTLPSGYIFSKLVGEIYNESTGHFRSKYQRNETTYQGDINKQIVGTSGVATTLDISTMIPDYTIVSDFAGDVLFAGITNTSSACSIGFGGYANMYHSFINITNISVSAGYIYLSYANCVPTSNVIPVIYNMNDGTPYLRISSYKSII